MRALRTLYARCGRYMRATRGRSRPPGGATLGGLREMQRGGRASRDLRLDLTDAMELAAPHSDEPQLMVIARELWRSHYAPLFEEEYLANNAVPPSAFPPSERPWAQLSFPLVFRHAWNALFPRKSKCPETCFHTQCLMSKRLSEPWDSLKRSLSTKG